LPGRNRFIPILTTGWRHKKSLQPSRPLPPQVFGPES